MILRKLSTRNEIQMEKTICSQKVRIDKSERKGNFLVKKYLRREHSNDILYLNRAVYKE